jgi:Cu/Ag efflux pump CusA
MLLEENKDTVGDVSAHLSAMSPVQTPRKTGEVDKSAFAMIGGIAVATLLTLLFLPALYVAWYRLKEPTAKPTPEPSR